MLEKTGLSGLKECDKDEKTMNDLKDKKAFICDMDTVLVLSGVTSEEMLVNFPYRPSYILNGVGDII